MTLESLKSRLNIQKNRQISEKIIKSSMTFNENKPNFKNIKIGVSSFETSKYEILPAWRGKKQSQPNPIQTQYKPYSQKAKNERKFYYNNELQKFSQLAGKKQTQTNPKQIYLPKMFDMRTIVSNDFNL
jgi:hypothetical protein